MFEALFSRRVGFVGFMLLITAILLFIADRPVKERRPLSRLDALWIGCAQAVALLPGISRSGSTIATSLILGVDRYQAARFSFLMVVPLILGKIGYEVLLGDGMGNSVSAVSYIVGFAAAFITGVLACKWMIRIVTLSKLRYFGYYCIAVGLFAIILSLVVRG
jgi:undecaprenyl-diphosphatase